jgi:hypothetical protein
MLGGVTVSIGLFWFAWTNSPSIHWIASIAAGVPFGFGILLLFLAIINYLIDAYTIFAASVLAANTVLRSLFGAAFPLFTTQMYDNLGIHWASSIPAFLALVCMPFPFLFYRYGSWIRTKSQFAARADEFMKNLRAEMQQEEEQEEEQEEKLDSEGSGSVPLEKETTRAGEDEDLENKEPQDEAQVESDVEEALDEQLDEQRPRYERMRTARSQRSVQLEYDDNPYDIDRINTRESFGRALRTRTRSVADGGGNGRRAGWKFF